MSNMVSDIRHWPPYIRLTIACEVVLLLLVGTGSSCGPGTQAPPRPSMVFVSPSVTVSEGQTIIRLPSGRHLTLRGEYRARSSFWPDSALVFIAMEGLWSLDGNSTLPRAVFYHHGSGSLLGKPGWSFDEQTCYLWLDHSRGLTAMNIESGSLKTLLNLPTYSHGSSRHYDPYPVLIPHGCVVDGARLLVLLQERSNEKVPPWRRRADRVARHWMQSVPVEAPLDSAQLDDRRFPGEALAWTFSHQQEAAYALTNNEAKQSVETWSLAGDQRDTIDVPRQGAWRIALSPNEKTLLIELLRESDWKFGGGFILVDLESGEQRPGPVDGWNAAWSPNGRTIAYLSDWQLRLFDVEAQTDHLLASREPSAEGHRPLYFAGPVWSPDGRRLTAGIGGNDDPVRGLDDIQTLVLDLHDQEFLIYPRHARDLSIVPMPRPFSER